MLDEEGISQRMKELIRSSGSKVGIGSGYAPAHISGIFEIHNTNPNPLRCGSRGIGFCIDKGLSTIVITKKSNKQSIKILLNDIEVTGNTTKTTIRNLIHGKNIEIEVRSYTTLPISQGFGLSGAGALSSAIALNSALELDLEYFELVNAAHLAEISNHSGLGDVVAQATGGVVLRIREGGFQYGKLKILNITPKDAEILVWVLGNELKTAEIISSEKFVKLINTDAKKYLAILKKNCLNGDVNFKEIIRLSFKFASEIGIMENSVLGAITRIHDEGAGCASMVMLGNALFTIGNKTKLESICKDFGSPIIVKIDPARANSK